MKASAIQTVRMTLPQMTLMQVHAWQAYRSSQWMSSVSKADTDGTNHDIGGEEAFVEKANIQSVPFVAGLFSYCLNQSESIVSLGRAGKTPRNDVSRRGLEFIQFLNGAEVHGGRPAENCRMMTADFSRAFSDHKDK